MAIHLSPNLVLTLEAISANAGKLCFKNIVNSSNITATSFLVDGATSFPPSNMSNPATAFGWEAADTSDQTITITNDSSTEVDYIGIARHNLNQSGLEVTIKFDGIVVSPATSISDAQAQLFLFVGASPALIEIAITGATDPAKIAVVYVGKSLDLQRNIYVGHTPVTYGRDIQQMSGVSQSGEYLGEVRFNQTLSTSVSLLHLTPEWYRQNLDEFFGRVPRSPCFWAWRPGTYPAEVGYCWIEGNPRPVNQLANGMMSIDWNFRGIA